MSKEEILQIVEEEDVEFIRLQFTDIFGMLKNIAITAEQLEMALDSRFMFDGSSIEGFVSIEDSDMVLRPIPETFTIFPWRPQQGKVARFLCEVLRGDGTAFEGDPRYILKCWVKKAEEMGYRFMVGAECEFFLFSTDEEGNPTTKTKDAGTYFDVGPLDTAENIRRDIVLNLEEMGYRINASHHEIAPAQHEVDLDYQEVLSAADCIMTVKLAVRTLARRHGLHATFMPKPDAAVNGNGLHINMALFDRKGKNVFEDERDSCGISSLAYHFMGGIMDHMREMSLVTNPIVNSYKRLVPGHDAPAHIAWSSRSNRSTLIRIPSHQKGPLRIEFRCPDTAANPYLALASCLAAGLDGILQKADPGPGIDDNLFSCSEEEIKRRGIALLPATMEEAIEVFEKSSFMKSVFGRHAFDRYLYLKKKEWKAFSQAVTDWEIKEYLHKY